MLVHLINTIEYTYNKNYMLTKVKDAGRYTQVAEYDALGCTVKTVHKMDSLRLVSIMRMVRYLNVTDALSAAVIYTYNEMNHLATVRDKLGIVTECEYDPAGNAIKITDAYDKYAINENLR